MLQDLLIPEEFLQLGKLETAISLCDDTSFFAIIGVDSDELVNEFKVYLQDKINGLAIFEPKTESILSELKEYESKDKFILIDVSDKKNNEFIKNLLFFRDFISDYNFKILLILKKEHYKSIIKNAIDLYNIATFSYLFSTYKVDIVKEVNTADLDKMLKEYKEKKSSLSKKQKVAYLAEIAKLNGNLGEIKTSLEYFNQALKIAQKIKLKEAVMQIYFDMANLYRRISQYTVAEKYLVHCKQYSKDKHNIEQYKATLDAFILLYLQMDDYDKALSITDELYKLSIEIKDRNLELISLESYLSIYHRQRDRDRDKIVIYLKKVFDLATELNVKRTLANIYQIQAIDSMEENQFKKSLIYLDKALVIHKNNNELYMINYIYLLIAEVYYHLNSYDKSLVYLNWCNRYFLDNHIYESLTRSLYLFSRIESLKFNNDKALKYAFKSLKLSNLLATLDMKFNILLHISQIYNAQHNYKDALKFIDKASKLSSDKIDLFARYADTYKNMGELDKAYEYHKKALDLVDSSSEKVYIDELYGEILFKDGKLEEALKYFQNVLKLARKIDDFHRLMAVEENLGHLYKKMGNMAMARRFFMEVITKLKVINASDRRIKKLTDEITL